MILHDFQCSSCETNFEALVPSEQTQTECVECGATAERVISAPHVGVMNDPTVRGEALRKRSHEHSVRQAKQNPERLASKVGGEPRVQNPWNVRTRKSPK